MICPPGLRGAVAAAAGVLLLTACGQVHPGAAAVVGDTRISMDQLDSLSRAYCRATVAIGEVQGQPVEPRQGVESRRAVLGAMLQLELSRGAAESLGVEVPPSSYTVDEQQYRDLLDAVDDEYDDEVVELVRINAETSALLVAIGAHELGQDVTQVEQEQAAQQGQQVMAEFAADVDIDVDPRLGLASDGQVLAETGSLSVPVSDEATPAQDAAAATSRLDALPDSQVCR